MKIEAVCAIAPSAPAKAIIAKGLASIMNCSLRLRCGQFWALVHMGRMVRQLRSILTSPRAGTVLCLQTLMVLNSGPALSGAHVIYPDELKRAEKEYDECKLSEAKSIQVRYLDFVSDDLDVILVSQYEGIYCLILKDKRLATTQAIMIANFLFIGVYVSDIMSERTAPLLFQFASDDLSTKLEVGIRDRKIVIEHK